jgi:hypothetical protein
MRVKLRTIMAGPSGTFQPGQIADLHDDQAHALVAGGYADLVDDPVKATIGPPPVEAAMLEEAPETAVTRRGRPTRGREA